MHDSRERRFVHINDVADCMETVILAAVDPTAGVAVDPAIAPVIDVAAGAA